MTTWIFQANPDGFDIDGFLATEPVAFTWLVTRYASDMAVDDRVFIWRTQGTGGAKGIPGVIAETAIVEPPKLRADDAGSSPFWRGEDMRGTGLQVRAMLRLQHVASKRGMITRDWCKVDPVLRDLTNLRQSNGTNYRLTDEQAARLLAMWAKAGRDWTRDEAVAGLWAYATTFGGSVSERPGSPVAQVALLTGRAVPGVYNKVMNFRAIDPRDGRSGFSGGGSTDRAVWAEFFDTDSQAIRLPELTAEFVRVWPTPTKASSFASVEPAISHGEVERAAKALERRNLSDLLSRYQNARQFRRSRPKVTTVETRAFERDPLVIAIARQRASHRCEVPGCIHQVFVGSDGQPYSEVHHIMPLNDGGEDTIENVACVCPSHHRQAHLGVESDRLAIRKALTECRQADSARGSPSS